MTTSTTPWTYLPLAAIDLETTGPDPRTDRVTRVTVLMLDNEADVSSWSCGIDPGFAVPGKRTHVLGRPDVPLTSPERFEARAETILELIRGRVLVAHNGLRFDIPPAPGRAGPLRPRVVRRASARSDGLGVRVDARGARRSTNAG